MIQRTLFIICAGNELFFLSLYLMKWVKTPIAPGTFDNISYPHALALATFPICFLKNVINMVQLWKASKILVGVDLAERAKALQREK
jgi:CDP-diacylglycerol--inositol 3-phosphatidyltransferase